MPNVGHGDDDDDVVGICVGSWWKLCNGRVRGLQIKERICSPKWENFVKTCNQD